MGMQKQTYQGVEISYMADAVTAEFCAHFELPSDERRTGGFQREVRRDMAPRLQAGKNRVQGSSEREVLERAKAAIDRYLAGDC